jgi:hypothetical protein
MSTLTPARDTYPGASGDQDPVQTRRRRGWRGPVAAGALVLAAIGGAGAATNGFGAFNRQPGAAAPGEDRGRGGDTDNIPVVSQTDPTRIEQAVQSNAKLREALTKFAGSDITGVLSEDLTAERPTAASTMVTFADGSFILVSSDAVGLKGGGGTGLSRGDVESKPDIWNNPEGGPGGNADAYYQAGRSPDAPGSVQVVGFNGSGTPFFMQAQLKNLEGVTDYGLRLEQLAAATGAFYATGVFGR